jgi:hypothetical protein
MENLLSQFIRRIRFFIFRTYNYYLRALFSLLFLFYRSLIIYLFDFSLNRLAGNNNLILQNNPLTTFTRPTGIK